MLVLALVLVFTGAPGILAGDGEVSEFAGALDSIPPADFGASPVVVLVPDSILAGLEVNPGAWLGALVRVLVAGRVDEAARARAIHDWVALNIHYDIERLDAGHPPADGVTDVLRTGRSTCQGYANLFQRMCELAGLECATIEGYSRGDGFHELADENPSVSNHAWNAVRVGGRWRLVDATWDAGRVRDGEYVQSFSTDYLGVEPGVLVYTHLPADSAWQLLDHSLSAGEFSRLPYLRAEFFRLGLRLATPLERVTALEPPGRRAEFALEVPPGVSLFCRLFDATGGKVGPQAPGEPSATRRSFNFDLPAPGEWSVVVYARRGEPAGRYVGVARLGFVRPAEATTGGD